MMALGDRTHHPLHVWRGLPGQQSQFYIIYYDVGHHDDENRFKFEGVNKTDPSITNYSRVDILRLANLSVSSAHDFSAMHQLTLT